MLTLLKREDINEKLWNLCTDKQMCIYAKTWYLDIVSSNWIGLVINDYQAVMPLPVRKKIGINILYQPYFCQQLGVFGVFDEKILHQCFKYIDRHFFIINYHINFFNYKLYNVKKFSKKANYRLDISTDYQTIENGFRKEKFVNIKQLSKKEFTIENCEPQTLIDFFVAHHPKNMTLLSKQSYQILHKLMANSIENNRGKIFAAKLSSEILGMIFWLISENTAYLLFSAVSELGRKEQAINFLINHFILNHQKQILTLDFEGSSIPNIAFFYKGFGALNYEYGHIKKKIFNIN